MFFSDLHVQLLSKGILEPGEQLLGQTVTSYLPWWALGLINRQYLVLATDRRLVLVDHRVKFFPVALFMHQVQSIPWSQVQEAKVKGLFMKKKLSIKGVSDRGPVSLKAVIPNGLFGLLAPMKNNMLGARAVASTFESNRSGAPALGAAYAQQPAAISYAPPAPQLPQGAYGAPPVPQAGYGQPQIPAQNAPGYASVPPPPSAHPQYGAPYGAPPAPPGYPPRSWS